MPYIPFTDEQKRTANSVDLAEFLRCQGEHLIRSGPEMRMKSNHSITINGNKWYDHAIRKGGGPVDFVQYFYNMDYQGAMQMLLGGYGASVPFPAAMPKAPKPEKEFEIPKANKNMRRVFAYLSKSRGIDPKVLSTFARKELIYEDAAHHNAVFVGRGVDGTPRHAHLRSTQSFGKTFRINETGSKPQYSFHWVGQNDTLYAFEAPIDLLSYISLYPEEWEDSSYVALCGLSEKPILWMLEQYPNLKQITLCLDNDQAGIEATKRITDILAERGYEEIICNFSMRKDWNEDLTAAKGLVQDEQRGVRKLDESMLEELVSNTSADNGKLAKTKIPALLGQRNRYLQIGLPSKAATCLKSAAFYAISAAMREYHQMGKEISQEDAITYVTAVHEQAKVGDNLDEHLSEIQMQSQGIHTADEKHQIAESWLTFAAECLGSIEPTQKMKRADHQTATLLMGGMSS